MRIAATSGYYNPLHAGHLALFEAAKKHWDYLVVIVNNDDQVKLKGSTEFMNQEERLVIIKAIKYVNHAVIAVDKDRTVLETLKMIRPDAFLKGGDSTAENTPELAYCKESGINVYFGIGGPKVQSSSWLKKQP